MVLGIYGTGGAGKEAYELYMRCDEEKQKWDRVVFIDDTKPAGDFWGCEMLPFEDFKNKYDIATAKIIIAVGEPLARKFLYERVKADGYNLATIIHPTVLIGTNAQIGEGVLIQDYVAISVEATIGNNVCINGRTVIGHNVNVGDNCQISSHVIIGGGTNIADNVFVGMASSIRDHISVGEAAVISMGAVVMKDAKPEKVYMGNPAREIADSSGKVFK